MFHARLTAKGFAELPTEVRDALDIQPGDVIGYQIDHGAVTPREVDLFDSFDNPFATFTEGAADLDQRAFRDL